MTDPIQNELWLIKDGLAKECEHDLQRLFDKLKTAQMSTRKNVVKRIKSHPSKVNPR
jgi:hypothetical protein